MYLTTHAQTLFGSNIEEAYSSAEVAELLDSIQRICDHMKESHQTAKLWIQYFELVQIMIVFVRTERTGNWHLHLYTVKQMLPYLHAAGHLAYARSAHLYAQQIEGLNSEVQHLLESGYVTIRRSDKFWGGKWSDMTIQQVLMMAIKTSEGLTGE